MLLLRSPQPLAGAALPLPRRRRAGAPPPPSAVAVPDRFPADDWRRKAKPIAPGSPYPAKEFCSNCGARALSSSESFCRRRRRSSLARSLALFTAAAAAAQRPTPPRAEAQGCATRTTSRRSRRPAPSWGRGCRGWRGWRRRRGGAAARPPLSFCCCCDGGWGRSLAAGAGAARRSLEGGGSLDRPPPRLQPAVAETAERTAGRPAAAVWPIAAQRRRTPPRPAAPTGARPVT